MNGRNSGGKVDILSLAGLGFLVVSLIAVSVVAANPIKKQLTGAYARYSADALIRQRERAGGCTGKYCLAEEVIKNQSTQGNNSSAAPSAQTAAEQEIIDTYNKALTGDQTARDTLKKNNADLSKQVEDQLAKEAAQQQAQPPAEAPVANQPPTTSENLVAKKDCEANARYIYQDGQCTTTKTTSAYKQTPQGLVRTDRIDTINVDTGLVLNTTTKTTIQPPTQITTKTVQTPSEIKSTEPIAVNPVTAQAPKYPSKASCEQDLRSKGVVPSSHGSYAACNIYASQEEQLHSLDVLTGGAFTPYVAAFQQPLQITWQKAGYSTLQDCQKDQAQKHGPFAAQSCNTYTPTKSQVATSVQLGSNITAEAALIATPVTSLAELGTGATLKALGSKILVNTLAVQAQSSTGNAAATCIVDPATGKCATEAFLAALSWANVGAIDYVANAASVGTQQALQNARIVNVGVSGLNAGFTGSQAVQTCFGKNFSALGCVVNTTFTAAAAYAGATDLNALYQNRTILNATQAEEALTRISATNVSPTVTNTNPAIEELITLNNQTIPAKIVTPGQILADAKTFVQETQTDMASLDRLGQSGFDYGFPIPNESTSFIPSQDTGLPASRLTEIVNVNDVSSISNLKSLDLPADLSPAEKAAAEELINSKIAQAAAEAPTNPVSNFLTKYVKDDTGWLPALRTSTTPVSEIPADLAKVTTAPDGDPFVSALASYDSESTPALTRRISEIENQVAVLDSAQVAKIVYESKYTDDLTGLVNKAGFKEGLDLEIHTCCKNNTDLTVVTMDLKKFKEINDIYGHDVGDIALKTVAEILKENSRNTDLVVRLSGDEFAMILPQTNQAEAQSLMQRILDALEEQKATGSEGSAIKRINIDYGIKQWNSETDTVDNFLHELDVKMYGMKRGASVDPFTQIWDGIKNFFSNPASERAGGILIRLPAEANPPLPQMGIYYPQGNTLIEGYEVRISANGAAEIKTGDTFIPLIDGVSLPGTIGGKVLKAQNNFYYISDLENGYKVTLLTGEVKEPNLFQRLTSLVNNNTTANKTIKDLVASGTRPSGYEDAAKMLIENGYDFRNINSKTVTNFVDDFYTAYYAKNPSLAPPYYYNLPRSVYTLAKVGYGITGGVTGLELYTNRDAIFGYFRNLTQPGYYSPFLKTRIVYKDGKWYRADTNEDISNQYNISYQVGTTLRPSSGAIFSFQHDTIDQSTFESPEWKAFSVNILNETSSNPYDIDAITKAIYDNMAYNYSASNGLFYIFPDRNFQNVLAHNLNVCFEFATAEQTYLAQLGIPTEMADGTVDFNDGTGRGGHAFLIITDKSGKKWVLDPTNNHVKSYDDYIKDYKVQDLEITPSIYKFTNPEKAPDFTIGQETLSTESVVGVTPDQVTLNQVISNPEVKTNDKVLETKALVGSAEYTKYAVPNSNSSYSIVIIPLGTDLKGASFIVDNPLNRETTLGFLTESQKITGQKVDIAINGDGYEYQLYQPDPINHPEIKYYRSRGLTMVNGVKFDKVGSEESLYFDQNGKIILDKNAEGVYVLPKYSESSIPSQVKYVISYPKGLIDGGVKEKIKPTDDAQPNSRTALGITQNGDLILLTVNGKQTGGGAGIEGMSVKEVQDLMAKLGAVVAVNFDGGGSTKMVGLDANGNPIVLGTSNENNKVANHLGIIIP